MDRLKRNNKQTVLWRKYLIEVLPEYLLDQSLLVKLLESLGRDLDKVSESEEAVLQQDGVLREAEPLGQLGRRIHCTFFVFFVSPDQISWPRIRSY